MGGKGSRGQWREGRGGRGGDGIEEEEKNDLTQPLSQIPGSATDHIHNLKLSLLVNGKKI